MLGIPSIHRHRYVPMKKMQVHEHVNMTVYYELICLHNEELKSTNAQNMKKTFFFHCTLVDIDYSSWTCFVLTWKVLQIPNRDTCMSFNSVPNNS